MDQLRSNLRQLCYYWYPRYQVVDIACAREDDVDARLIAAEAVGGIGQGEGWRGPQSLIL